MPPRQSNAFLNALRANDPASAVIEVARQLQQSASLKFLKKEVAKIVDLLREVALANSYIYPISFDLLSFLFQALDTNRYDVLIAIMRIFIRESESNASGRNSLASTAVDLIKNNAFGPILERVDHPKALALSIQAYQSLLLLDPRNLSCDSTPSTISTLIDIMMSADSDVKVALKVCHPL